jgi:hypothetical protein
VAPRGESCRVGSDDGAAERVVRNLLSFSAGCLV